MFVKEALRRISLFSVHRRPSGCIFCRKYYFNSRPSVGHLSFEKDHQRAYLCGEQVVFFRRFSQKLYWRYYFYKKVFSLSGGLVENVLEDRFYTKVHREILIILIRKYSFSFLKNFKNIFSLKETFLL